MKIFREILSLLTEYLSSFDYDRFMSHFHVLKLASSDTVTVTIVSGTGYHHKSCLLIFLIDISSGWQHATSMLIIHFKGLISGHSWGHQWEGEPESMQTASSPL